ncbi:MAG: universal stress protein [Desulfarculus sp.]|nr:universal stress protein [Desulfarculus sp.]
MFQHVLFPVDFSENNRKVAPYVRDLVTSPPARLHLLYVVRDLSHYAGFYVPHPNLEGLAQELVKGAQRKMDEFRQAYFGDLTDVETKVMVGDPAECIVEQARGQGIDLIVMGTHGRRGLDHALFGSVAEKVVRNSATPVLTVNPYRL